MRFHLQSLVNDVPVPIITTCCEIINDVQYKFEFTFQDYIYVTLTHHLHHAVNIHQNNQKIQTFSIDVKSIHPRAFESSLYALTIIKRNLNISFPAYEANNLALHFINAEQPEGIENQTAYKNKNIQLNDLINCLNQIGITRNKSNEYYYDRFIQHLKYLTEHILDYSEDLSQQVDISFQQHLKTHYPNSYLYAKDLYHAISRKFNIVINQHHLFYFQLHIERILSSQKGGTTRDE
ncbi:PRD domain-containing protein [Mammaliicoccus sciuri]|nr:PRD domain-containing protein [Mammaliicoccus sciuri]